MQTGHDIHTVAITDRKDSAAAALLLTVGCEGHDFGCLAALPQSGDEKCSPKQSFHNFTKSNGLASRPR